MRPDRRRRAGGGAASHAASCRSSSGRRRPCRAAPAALRALAEKPQAPVVMSENGRGALSDRHPLALNARRPRGVRPRRCRLVVGSRFADAMLGVPSWLAPGIIYAGSMSIPQHGAPPRSAEVSIVGRCAPRSRSAAAALPPRRPRATRLARCGPGRASSRCPPSRRPTSARCAPRFPMTASW